MSALPSRWRGVQATAATEPPIHPLRRLADRPEDTPDDTTTPEDTPEDTPTPTPEPDPLSFEEIYEEEMVLEDVGRQVDWAEVRDELRDDGHDLDNLKVSSEFIEDLAGHAGRQVYEDQGAAALAYGLQKEFDISTDEVIVDARTFNSGLQAPMASILIQQEDGGVVKDMWRPLGQRQEPDAKNGDVPSYKRHDETNNLYNAEQDITDAWNAAKEGIANPLDLDGHKALIDSTFGGKIDGQEGYNFINQLNDDFIIGYDADNDPMDIGYTLDGAQVRSDVLDPSNINASSEAHKTFGIDAWKLVRKGTEFVYNNVKDEEKTFAEFDYSTEGLTGEYSERAVEIELKSRAGSIILDTVDEDRMQELTRAPFPEYN